MRNIFVTNVGIILLCLLINTPSKSIAAIDEGADTLEFYDACSEGDTTVVSKWLRDMPEIVKEVSPEGESCLMLSSISESLEMVKILVEAGADINQRAVGEDTYRMTVLAWHVLSGNVETIKYLIEVGVDINAEFDGIDPVLESVVFTSLDLVEFLLDPTDEEEGMMPNEMSVNHKSVRDLLLKSGAKKFVGSAEL